MDESETEIERLKRHNKMLELELEALKTPKNITGMSYLETYFNSELYLHRDDPKQIKDIYLCMEELRDLENKSQLYDKLVDSISQVVNLVK